MIIHALLFLLVFCFIACGDDSSVGLLFDNGVCTECDNYKVDNPKVFKNGGSGSVTTYGSISKKETSLGGACNNAYTTLYTNN